MPAPTEHVRRSSGSEAANERARHGERPRRCGTERNHTENALAAGGHTDHGSLLDGALGAGSQRRSQGSEFGHGFLAPDRIAHGIRQGVGLGVPAVRVLGAVGLIGDTEQAGHRSAFVGPHLGLAAVRPVGVVGPQQAVVIGDAARGEVDIGVFLNIDLGALFEQRDRTAGCLGAGRRSPRHKSRPG